MYDLGVKLLNGIKSMYINSLACVRVKRGESEGFRINSGVRQGYICPLGSPMYIGTQGGENGDGEEGSEISGGGKSGDCLASCMQMN